MVLAPVTAPLHAPACPRCGGRLVQLEEPTCLPCGFADYSLPGLTCGICMEPLTGDRQRYCSTACVTLAGNRRKAQAARNRVRLGLCVRCGIPADATYCPRPPGADRGGTMPAVRRARRDGNVLRAPSTAGQRASQLNGFAVGPRGPASYETPQLRTSAAICRSPAANESIVRRTP